jgi:hypothetical protein
MAHVSNMKQHKSPKTTFESIKVTLFEKDCTILCTLYNVEICLVYTPAK